MNANQVFNWLKDPAFAPRPEDLDAARFLPVEIVAPVQSTTTPAAVAGGEIEVELVGGNCLKIIGAYDPDALARLIRGLSG